MGAAGGLGRNGWGAALLIRDVGDRLVPPGNETVPIDQHRKFIDDMAALHAEFWGFRDSLGLLPAPHRWMMFGQAMIESELALPKPPLVPSIAARGWKRFGERAPTDVVETVTDLRRDPTRLVEALWRYPRTLVHGDWKMGNLGSHPDGRTILLDWQAPGEAPGTSDLSWYLCLNASRCRRARKRRWRPTVAALERCGVETTDFFDAQMGLCLLGALVQFGWEKALGSDAELAWWLDRAREGARFL